MTQWKPKQLEWEGLKAKNGSGIEYYLDPYKNGDYHAFCCAAITEPLDRYENEQEAKAACQADFEKRWQAMSEPSEIDENLIDEIDCLKSELDCAIETAFNRGAHEWVKLNYPKHYEKLSLNAKPVTEPQPFWKPIEQCPKEKDSFYLISWPQNIFTATWGNENWCDAALNLVPYGDHATHYAEIPPLEASK